MVQAETSLIDFASYPEIYADGLGSVEIIGANARLALFSWRRIDGVFRRQICGLVIRPVALLSSDFEMVEVAKRNATPEPLLKQVVTLQ
jgi:hypothetical protein